MQAIYNEITQSIINGQKKQAKEQLKSLSISQLEGAEKHFAQKEGNTYLGFYRVAKEYAQRELEKR